PPVTPVPAAGKARPDASTVVDRPDERVTWRAIDLEHLAGVPRELAVVIRRCLDPDPARRYQTAGELAAARSGAWQLLAARRALARLARPSRVGRWVSTHPTLGLAVVSVLPHLVASAAQIGYNAVEVKLDDAQHRAFTFVVIA